MAQILKGAPVAAALSDDLIKRAEKLRASGVVPTLAILRVGERPDDISYATGAIQRGEKIGIQGKRFLVPASWARETLLNAISEINADDSIHGCLMFRPLPNKEDEAAACAMLSPEKDVDCMTSGSLSSVFTGKGAGYPPCTAQACIELLDYYGIELSGKRAVVIGRSLVIGKPVSMMLQARNATVTMCHTKTVDMPAVCRDSELVIAAAGKAGVVDVRFASPGQVIVDVGINIGEDGKLCGDVKFDDIEAIVSGITPVPAGVGAVTTAVLAKHIVEAAEKTLT